MPSVEAVLGKFGLTFTPRMTMPIEIPGGTRDKLAKWFCEWDLERGVEVGTFSAEYALILLEANPSLYLTCVDPWRVYPNYPDYMRQSTLERAYEVASERLAPHYGRCSIMRMPSVDAARTFKDGFLDFVYIDGNHDLLHCVQDIYAWSPKVRPGGVIAGHDYIKRSRWPHVHVVEAVHAYTSAMYISPWFVLGKRGESGEDRCRSWMWVKPDPHMLHGTRIGQS